MTLDWKARTSRATPVVSARALRQAPYAATLAGRTPEDSLIWRGASQVAGSPSSAISSRGVRTSTVSEELSCDVRSMLHDRCWTKPLAGRSTWGRNRGGSEGSRRAGGGFRGRWGLGGAQRQGGGRCWGHEIASRGVLSTAGGRRHGGDGGQVVTDHAEAHHEVSGGSSGWKTSPVRRRRTATIVPRRQEGQRRMSRPVRRRRVSSGFSGGGGSGGG